MSNKQTSEGRIKLSPNKIVLNSVNIESVENGFILTENPINHGNEMVAQVKPKHVFESKDSLYDFLADNFHTNNIII